jgi:hypothetical protein
MPVARMTACAGRHREVATVYRLAGAGLEDHRRPAGMVGDTQASMRKLAGAITLPIEGRGDALGPVAAGQRTSTTRTATSAHANGSRRASRGRPGLERRRCPQCRSMWARQALPHGIFS